MSADVLIGVYPPAELSALRARRTTAAWPLLEPGLTLTHLGRGAVWLVLRALGLRPGNRLAMPAYHCGSEVEAARLAGLEIDFYRVDDQLRVDEEDLARAAAGADAVYLISCFGFPMAAHPAGSRVIEDAAHGLFSQHGEAPLGAGSDAAIFCPRKSLGTPDGGAVLLPPGRRIDATDGRPPAGPMARSVASLVAGRAAIARPRPLRARAARAIAQVSRGDAAAHAGTLTETVIGEWNLDVADMEAAARAPSRITAAALGRVDGTAIRARRRHNYLRLRDELAERTLEPFRDLPDGACPLYFPLLAGDRPRTIAALLQRGVRPLEVWPVPHPILDRERFSELEALRRGLLALPVHQGLEDWHMDIVLDAVKDVLATRSD
ncbi:MAG: DegT/DnrJ/EryC1/StrS family aminotransferase [Actinomycetota bacterium]|nr:DegT/DnrJ/EryC1/StrS family aminotransferase [Actinomycetota bacterium]